MRISDWSSDVCSSDLAQEMGTDRRAYHLTADYTWGWTQEESMKNTTEELGWETVAAVKTPLGAGDFSQYITPVLDSGADVLILNPYGNDRSEEHTSELQSLMRISYAVFCLQKKNHQNITTAN